MDPAISALVSGDSLNIKPGRGTCSQILIKSGTWFGLWDAAAVLYPSTFPNSQDSKFSPVTGRERQRERERAREKMIEDLNPLPCRVRVVFHL